MASSQGSDASKASLRNNYLQLCQSMPASFAQGIDDNVRTMFKRLDLFRDASTVLFYLPIHEEIDTMPLMEAALAAGKRVALPLVEGKGSGIKWYCVDAIQSITRGSRGLAKAPAGQAPLGLTDMLGSLCLVPGLVFDGEGYRIGYGAGYYDEFLAFYPGNKVGLVRSVQVSSNPLPHDDHDIPVDVLVTEGSIWRCRRLL